MSQSYRCRQLSQTDVEALRVLIAVFSAAFEDPDQYGSAVPSDRYLADLLASPTFIAVVAEHGDGIVGGIAAYELVKFEQERKEIYIYDLAVAEAHRRRGVATSLIRELVRIAASRGASVVFVQAEAGDAPALALYRTLGSELAAHHFDFRVPCASE